MKLVGRIAIAIVESIIRQKGLTKNIQREYNVLLDTTIAANKRAVAVKSITNR